MTTAPKSSYRSSSTLATCITVLGIAAMIIAALTTFTTTIQIYVLDSAKFGAGIPLAVATDERQRLLALIQLSVALPGLILFLMWVYRVNRNARALGAVGMQYTPASSVGWFFVPVIGLFLPYFVIKEIWQASSPVPARQWRRAPVSPILGSWWLVGIVGSMIQYSRLPYLTGKNPTATVLRLLELGSNYAPVLESELENLWGLLIADLVGVSMIALTLAVVLRITELQESRQIVMEDLEGNRESGRESGTL